MNSTARCCIWYFLSLMVAAIALRAALAGAAQVEEATPPASSETPSGEELAVANLLGSPGGSCGTSNRLRPERTVRWRTLGPNLLQDQKAIWSFPTRVAKGEHARPVLGFALATAALVALDPHDTPYFRRTTSFEEFNKVLSGRNTALGLAISSGAFYAIGLRRHHSYEAQTALFAAEAVADTEFLTLVMKNVDRRLRPSDIPRDGDFSHTWFKSRGTIISGRNASFPSGHAIAAFSIATVIADRYPAHRWVPWVAHGLAGLIGFSRLPLQAHFPSDVFAGALLGYTITHSVVLRQ